MAETRKKILAMLAEGKISVDEASQLLEKVNGASPEEPGPRQGETAVPKNPRYLRITVNSSDGDKVNVRVPLSLIKTGIKLGALMPKEAAEAVSEKGIDLSILAKLDENALAEALSELQVDVDSSDGDVVRIFAE